jgi:Domain of unknown function (DUF1772)
MLAAALTTVAAALFTGGAIYVNVAEQPARQTLEDGAMLAQWQASYRRAAPMQGGLALVGTALGCLAAYQSGDWRWLAVAGFLFANWPYTLIAIKPVNDALQRLSLSTPGPEARRLIANWGKLHAARSALGALAVFFCICAAS